MCEPRDSFYRPTLPNLVALVGFVAAAVSVPMGGCRAVAGSLLPAIVADVAIAVGPAVL